VAFLEARELIVAGEDGMSGDDCFAPEFDSFAHDYAALHNENVKAFGYPTSYFAEYKIKEVASHLATIGLAEERIKLLNFGCGIGNSEDYIRKYLVESVIYSVDISPKSIEYTRERHKNLENIYFGVFGGRAIPFNLSFDVIFIANVLHHVPRAQHLRILRMLNQALSPSGHLFIFEHNPLNPVTVRAVKACPFDKGVKLLSPVYVRKVLSQAQFNRRTLRFTLFFPKALEFLTPAEKYLRKVPLGAQYYFIAGKN
jgi:SAM-dependent methyltransferase